MYFKTYKFLQNLTFSSFLLFWCLFRVVVCVLCTDLMSVTKIFLPYVMLYVLCTDLTSAPRIFLPSCSAVINNFFSSGVSLMGIFSLFLRCVSLFSVCTMLLIF